MQIRPNAFTIGLIIHPSIALFCVYTEFGIDSHNGEILLFYHFSYILYFCVMESKKLITVTNYMMNYFSFFLLNLKYAFPLSTPASNSDS